MKTIYKKGTKIQFKKRIQYQDIIQRNDFRIIKFDDGNSVSYKNQPNELEGIIEKYDFIAGNYIVKYRLIKNNGLIDYDVSVDFIIDDSQIINGSFGEMMTIYEKGDEVKFKKNIEYKQDIEMRFIQINQTKNNNSVLYERQPEEMKGEIYDYDFDSEKYTVIYIPLKNNGQLSNFGETVSLSINSNKFIV